MKDHSPDNADMNRRKRPAKAPARRRSLIHIVWSATFGRWLVRAVKIFDLNDNHIDGFLDSNGVYYAAIEYNTLAEAVKAARRFGEHYQPSQIRIHGKDAKIRRDITIPKSSDPRKTRG